MKKKHIWVIIILSFIFIPAISYWFWAQSHPQQIPQRNAQNAVEATQRMINAALGQSYNPVSFGEVQPVYQSEEDSTVIGYIIDHDFSVVRNPSYADLSRKRYYLSDRFVVVNQQNHWPEIGRSADDEKGIAAIFEASANEDQEPH